MEYKISWLLISLNICFGLILADIAPNFYCNKNGKTWYAALAECLNVKGSPVAFHTGIGVNIEDIHLKSEADVWTADYAWQPQKFPAFEQEWLYGFNYLPKDPLDSDKMYSDSYVQRYYLCKNDTTNRLDVHKSVRDDVKCTERINQADLFNFAQYITPGYYWTDGKESVFIGVMNSLQNISSPVLCGAYSVDKEKYFVNCTKNKSSLCNIPDYTSEAQLYFSKSCLVNDNAESTVKQVSYTIPTTARDFHSTVQSTTALSSLSFTSLSSPSENVMARTTRESLAVNRTDVTNYDLAEKQDENDKNFGVSVGVPVGLGVAVLCGMVFGLYIMRRYKYWKSRSRPYGSKDVSHKNLPSSKPENVSVNKSYGLSIVKFHKGKKTSDKPRQKGDQPLQNSFPEYAVVRKKNPKTLSQGENKNPAAKENTNEHLQDFVCDENISYCYARAKHKKGVDLFVNSTANQNSEYSFAVEMAEDPPNTGEKDYDVTFNVTHFNTQNNTYNTLQLEEYGSFHNQRSGDKTYNILNIPNDQDPENDYDTANQRDHNVGTNSLYNHLC